MPPPLHRLPAARGADFDAVCAAADELRRRVCGDTGAGWVLLAGAGRLYCVAATAPGSASAGPPCLPATQPSTPVPPSPPAATYVVNRNINYTNVCTFACAFCAFRCVWDDGKRRPALACDCCWRQRPHGLPVLAASERLPAQRPQASPACPPGCPPGCCSKGKVAEELRGAPYLLPLEEVARRTAEAWDRGATEVCMQVRGGCRAWAWAGVRWLRWLSLGARCSSRLPTDVRGCSQRVQLPRLLTALTPWPCPPPPRPSTPAGRHPSRLHGRHLPAPAGSSQGRRTRHPRPRLQVLCGGRERSGAGCGL